MRILPISKRSRKYATKMEISNTYLVRIWYVLTLVRAKYVFTSLNAPFGTYLVRICFSKYVLRILIAYFRFFIAYFVLGAPKVSFASRFSYPAISHPYVVRECRSPIAHGIIKRGEYHECGKFPGEIRFANYSRCPTVATVTIHSNH